MEDHPIETALVLAKSLDGLFQIGAAIAISSLSDFSVAVAFAAVGVATSAAIFPEDCGPEFFLAAILASAAAICSRAATI